MSSTLPTRLNLRALRADSLHRILIRRRRDIGAIEDIPRLGELFSWPRTQIDVAVADLVAEGLLRDSPSGALIVGRAS